MKVLTLTTQFANNYGALLQCYALSRYLNNQDGIRCEVLNYLPKDYNRSWSLFIKPRSFKGFAKMIYSTLNIKYVIESRAKNKLMKDFIKRYIPLTENTYYRNTIVSNPPSADAFICGSDQIWNQIIFKDLTYYLDFVKSGKRISYAASMADPWSSEFEKVVAPCLNQFDSISMREKGNIPQAQGLVKDKPIQWVIDPVFLLGREGWDLMASNPPIEEPYIFCYFLNVDPFAVEVVNRLRKQTGYKVVNLGVDAQDKFHSDLLIRKANPCDFVGLIKNASYICTNSFHCSAFSIIYKKKFAFIPKTWANERVLSLQDIFSIDVVMTKEKYQGFSEHLFDIDYSKGKDKGEAFIESSKNYLRRALYD